MRLVFDTSVLIAIERGNQNILEKLKKLNEKFPGDPVISFITHFEFLYGLKKNRPKKFENIIHFLKEFFVLETTIETSDILSDLKLKYEKEGKSFSLSDLLIASQVIENNFVLVTMDRDFEDIKELKKIIILQ